MPGIYKSEQGQRAVEARYRALLAHWPVPNTELHVATREGTTFILACGAESAPPVVLLHGAAFNSLTWFGDAPLWSQHFRLYAVDVIGQPGLSAAARPPYDSERYALWLDDVLAELGVERAAFVGISLGGWLALDYAVRRPQRVTALVLLAPGGVGRELMSMAKMLFVILPLLLLGERGRRAAMRKMLGPLPGAEAEGARVVADFMTLIGKHFRQNFARVRRLADAELARLTMPALLIAGDSDPLLDSRETAARVKQQMPRAEVRLLEGVGHAVVGQTAPILEFLRRALVVGAGAQSRSAEQENG